MSGIFLAAGHGGTDSGATGNGLVERDLNVQLVTYIAGRLRAHKIVTATDIEHGNPTGITETLNLARQYSPALYYSQHHNWFGATARGYEIYKTGSGRSYRFAKALHDAQIAALRKLDPSIPDRGIKEARGTRAESEVVNSPGSSALSEALFVSNVADAAIAKRPDEIKVLGEATVKAIVEFGAAEGLAGWPAGVRYVAPVVATTAPIIWHLSRDPQGVLANARTLVEMEKWIAKLKAKWK